MCGIVKLALLALSLVCSYNLKYWFILCTTHDTKVMPINELISTEFLLEKKSYLILWSLFLPLHTVFCYVSFKDSFHAGRSLIVYTWKWFLPCTSNNMSKGFVFLAMFQLIGTGTLILFLWRELCTKWTSGGVSENKHVVIHSEYFGHLFKTNQGRNSMSIVQM